MIKDAILRLQNTLLFKKLQEKEQALFGNALLSMKVQHIVENVAPLLERVPENMREYTLHDPNHSAKVVENMGEIIPDETMKHLNPIEVALLILSGYLHDVGMTCSKEEKEKIIQSSAEFEILFKSDKDKYEKFQNAKAADDHRVATFLEDQVFTEYLRRNHVRRSADYIQKHLSAGELCLAYHDIPFWKHLIHICDGHGEPVSALSGSDKWPRHTLIGKNIINVQYLSLILRLADILDLDPERTPKVIYEFVNPQDPISILEWQKHRSVIGFSISPEKILFEAECSAPEVERALKEFMFWIEQERRETMELLSKHNDEISKKYLLHLNEEVATDRIRSDNSYISNDLKFQIEYQRVMELLMGQKLYKNPVLALRELLQNSIDAIKVRQAMFKNRAESFEPEIVIELAGGTLSVSDNGSGMDLDIFQNYFLQVGKSFYSSPVFYGRFSDVDVTSEFGIGVLSTFMIAHSITVESRREPDDPLNPPQPILFEIPTAFSYTIQRESKKTTIGTKITLALKDDNPFKEQSIIELLEVLIPKPPFPIKVRQNGEERIHSGFETVDIPHLDYTDNWHNKEVIKKYSGRLDIRCIYKILDLSFYESHDEDLKSIEGKAFLIADNVASNYFTKGSLGYLTQRSFIIGVPSHRNRSEFADKNIKELYFSSSVNSLFPKWTRLYTELNLSNQACLSITPDRTDLVVNDNYRRLQQKIEEFIILKLEHHFETIATESSKEVLFRYIDRLIDKRFLGIADVSGEHGENQILSFSKAANSFLCKYITVPVLQKDGSVLRMSITDLKSRSTIGLINKWNVQFCDMINERVDVDQIALVVLSELDFKELDSGISISRFKFLIRHLLTESADEFSNVIGIVTSCMPFFKIELLKLNHKSLFRPNHYQTVDLITDHITEMQSNLILTIDSRGLLNILFSCSHPINRAFIGIRPEEYFDSGIEGRIVKSLKKSFRKVADQDVDFFSKYDAHDDSFYVESPNDYYDLTDKIFIKDPDLLSRLQKDFEEHWQELKEQKIIEEDLEMPEITAKDFPRYWSE